MFLAHATGKRAAGFTLLELMITLTVAAILTAAAVPSFRTYVLNSRRDSLADSLVASLNYARNQALNLDQDTSLCAGVSGTACASSAWANGWVVVTAPASASTVLLATHVLPASSSVPGLRALGGSNVFTFNGKGLVANLPGPESLVICDSRGATSARAVEINVAGYIQSSPTPGLAPDGTTLTCP
jgi:type IV fimbrial biogenesis protein FimT